MSFLSENASFVYLNTTSYYCYFCIPIKIEYLWLSLWTLLDWEKSFSLCVHSSASFAFQMFQNRTYFLSGECSLWWDRSQLLKDFLLWCLATIFALRILVLCLADTTITVRVKSTTYKGLIK
jgi:hypothetical protein